MKFILGIKQNMGQIFDEAGNVQPVTVISASPNVVTDVRTAERDGYKAVQIGFLEQKEHRLSKAEKGHFKTLGGFKFVREFRLSEKDAPQNIGDKIDLSAFKEGDSISVSSVSKGKGFQGVVKRHGFHGGPRTHGQKHSEREPGSISGGLRTGPRHGMRMAGRMGGERVTVKNLKVAQVNSEAGLLLVRGAVPGRRGTLVEVRGL